MKAERMRIRSGSPGGGNEDVIVHHLRVEDKGLLLRHSEGVVKPRIMPLEDLEVVAKLGGVDLPHKVVQAALRELKAHEELNVLALDAGLFTSRSAA